MTQQLPLLKERPKWVRRTLSGACNNERHGSCLAWDCGCHCHCEGH